MATTLIVTISIVIIVIVTTLSLSTPTLSICRQWIASVFSCPTCLTPSLPGSACWRLEGCGHVFCSQCVVAHVAARLAEGEVTSGSGGSGSSKGASKGMGCPDCAAPLTQGDVRAALGGHRDERYARYESLLLTATLESLARADAAAAGGPGAAAGISGVVYCPRPWCSKPAVPVPASAGSVAVPRPRHVTGSSDAYTVISPLAQCPYCDFMFCMVSRGGVISCKNAQPRAPLRHWTLRRGCWGGMPFLHRVHRIHGRDALRRSPWGSSIYSCA